MVEVLTTKSAIGCILLGVLYLLTVWNNSLAWLPSDSTLDTIMGIVATLTGLAFRSAIAKGANGK